MPPPEVIPEATPGAPPDGLPDDLLVSMFWRGLILDACREVGVDELPGVASDDHDIWLNLVEHLRERILWDLDYLDDRTLDDPPERRDVLLEYMRIPESYYTAIAPEPRPGEVDDLIRRLRTITGH